MGTYEHAGSLVSVAGILGNLISGTMSEPLVSVGKLSGSVPCGAKHKEINLVCRVGN